MAVCVPEDLLADGKCFACLTEKQLDIAIVQLLRQWLGIELTPETLLERGKLFQSLTTKELEIAQAQLLCNING